MSIDEPGNSIREEVDAMRASANRFAVIVVVLFALSALPTFFFGRTFFSSIPHTVELIQAILVCSTALMGLTGLMIIETKKTNVTGLSSDDIIERIKAINTITSLARAHVFLRWALLLSIFSLVLSSLRLMVDDAVFIVGALTAFVAQVYLYVWGLVFSDFLPS